LREEGCRAQLACPARARGVPAFVAGEREGAAGGCQAGMTGAGDFTLEATGHVRLLGPGGAC
jgi:hypothetical protein